MVRVPLEELVLQIHMLRLGPAASFLGKVIEPPPPKSVAAAVSQLQDVGALSPDEALTPLGDPSPPLMFAPASLANASVATSRPLGEKPPRVLH